MKPNDTIARDYRLLMNSEALYRMWLVELANTNNFGDEVDLIEFCLKNDYSANELSELLYNYRLLIDTSQDDFLAGIPARFLKVIN
jgi:hypothetical protein